MSSKTERNNKQTRGKHVQKLSLLKKKETELDQASQNNVPHSFREVTKPLAGSVRGPNDLAHNKKHMQGFGQ